ncbi:hypothetical protein [Ancylobacter polymorphus]|uniref:Uncharacterized protein n=1 Tax=Ancylobacter polymorphus TaxID=223390 RepID=A0A9E7A3T0_9HYPH|nr:hypothetical protein [Ancylobacter polymorphus]UOK73965.1 hypothetical protein K9D25_24805 [Ancylobacter polymorphus]
MGMPSPGQRLLLTADWTVTINSNRDRLWKALGCDRDPTVAAAGARIDERISRMKELLARGIEFDDPHQEWIDGKWVTVQTRWRVQPKDERTMKRLSREQMADSELMRSAPATIAATSVLEVIAVFPAISGSHDHIRLNIISTPMEELRFKKDGGSLSNGKRILMVTAEELARCSYDLLETAHPPSGKGGS